MLLKLAPKDIALALNQSKDLMPETPKPKAKKDYSKEITALEQERIENISLINGFSATLNKRLMHGSEIESFKLRNGQINKKIKELRLKGKGSK